jgi:hypothetical protein
VLLPSSKRIEVMLDRDSVQLALSEGRKAHLRTERRVTAGDVARFDSLIACVGALGTELDALAASGTTIRGARLDVAVADQWLIYDIVEIDLRDLSDRDAESAVAALLADTAGVEPACLAARWQTIAEPALQLACAMPADAVAALGQLVRRHGLRWGRVQGEFIEAFNSHRDELDGVTAALAVIRPHGAQIGVVASGALAALHYEEGSPVLDRLAAICENLVRRAGHEIDNSMRYLADSTQVELCAPWSGLLPAK